MTDLESDNGGLTFASSSSCTCVADLMKQINLLRNKQSSLDPDGFTVVSQTDKHAWTKIFAEYFLINVHCIVDKCSAHSDDMLWYVRTPSLTSFYLDAKSSIVEVFRRQSKKQPVPGDATVNWEETVCLNLILQQLDFHVTCAVCTKTSPQNLQIVHKNVQRVHPSPSHRRMDKKGESEEITYPNIYFAIDDFEQTTSTWQWAQKLLSSDATARRQEFLRMRGPHGKGHAEMVVARVPNSGCDTPLGQDMSFNGLNNHSPHNGGRSRRLSETNLSTSLYPTASNNSGRWFDGRKVLSETDTFDQCPEVEANSIDDGAQLEETTTTTTNLSNPQTCVSHSEMEQGVFNRMWSVRGFGQSWHWLREKRRAACTPLNAYLTYVTLPWSTILDDLLERPRRPILSFDIDSVSTNL